MITDEIALLFSILEHTPQGVLVVDEDARIQYANPGFRRMFSTSEKGAIGEKVAEFLCDDVFERAIAGGGQLSVRGRNPRCGVSYRASIFAIEGERCWCGILVDISEEEEARAALLELKRETLGRAEEVIRRQMRTAQEIAGLLGETTAETKVLLAQVMDLFRREGEP